MKKALVIIIPALFVIYYACYFYVQNSGAGKGEIAPDFQTELIDGSSFKLSDLRGGYVLLDFWGSWCGPCRKESPNLVALHTRHGHHLTIVSVALEKNAESGRLAAIQDGYIWKTQIVEQSSLVMLSEIARKYGVSEIPAKFLISPEGEILPSRSFAEIDDFMSSLRE